jgi:hypothetical protein
MDPSAEAELYEKLAALLNGEDYGLVTSNFSGERNNGPLPKPAKKAAPKK